MLNRFFTRRITAVLILTSTFAFAYGQSADSAHSMVINADQPGATINRDIFGQFAEHLGEGIYGGVWVGRDSKIPNVRGIRTDVVGALKALKVPSVRWPGGCFADEYHWRNGIGPADKRVTTINALWGEVLETNQFGTDEFMDFLNQIDAEAYITVNVGTGSPKEAAEWMEYMTAAKPTTLAQERASNGHREPYRVKYVGLGNEAWGCGGPFTPEEYTEKMKLYSHFVHNFNPAQDATNPFMSSGPDAMKRIAVGPDADNTEYTEAVMKAWSTRQPYFWSIEGLSMHSYTAGGKYPMTHKSIGFDEKDYATFLKETLGMEGRIAKQSAIMDKYDPKNQISLVIDEWGAWLQPLPGTPMLFLRQQNSIRDAVLASLNLNIFARHADRVRMTDIAQMVNVIQSMILTDKEKMLLTPTYYVYKMYVPFQEATFLPVKLEAGQYKFGDITVPQVHGIAARAKDGHVYLALTNTDPNRPTEVRVNLQGVSATNATGETLTAPAVDSVNTFDQPNNVVPKAFSASMNDGTLVLHLQPKSVTVVKLGE